MGIAGINGTFGMLNTTSSAAKTTQKADGVEFKKSALNCVSAGNQKTMLCSDALMSYASPQTGESVNIYRADNYSKDNPIYLVKGLDADGNEFEQEVDASKINPNVCSFNELMVLNVETGHTSPSDYLHSVAVRAKAGVSSYSTPMNYVSYAQEVMDDMKTTGSWDKYLSFDKWIQSLLSYASKKDN